MKGFCKNRSSLVILVLLWFNVGGSQKFLWAQQAPPAAQNSTSTPAAQPGPTPPPSSPPKRSTSDLEKLAAPIALYPDPVIAVLLPASAYPLEVVQAARFVRDTNNIANLDSQPWDSNVKAVARIPQVIKQMDDNIAWTSDLGDAFINQPKELMDAIQSMRTRAESSGALKTTPEQTVTVTETIVTNVVEQQTVYVTNQVTQIQPAQPNVVYVPQYNPTVVYAGYPVAYPAYTYPVYSPGAIAATSLLSFGAGMAMGAWLANDCDWGGGGCYHSDVNVNRDVNRNVNRNTNRSANRAQNRGQKWQPDQNRLKNSGSSLSSAQSREARGWSSASRQTGAGAGSARAGTTGLGSTRAGTSSGLGSSRAGTSSGLGSARAGTSSGVGSTRPGGGAASQRAQAQPSTSPGQSRPNASARSAPTGRTGSSQSVNRPSSSSRSAFNSSGGAAQTRASSARGASSRSFGGGGGGRGGGGRGGGGRR